MNFVEDHYRKPRGLLEGMRRVDSTSKREENFTIENQHKWNELKLRFLDQVFSFKEINSTNVTITIDFDLLKTQSFENRREFFTLCKQTFKVQNYTRIRVEWKRYSARDFKSKKKSRTVGTSLSQSHFTTQRRIEGPAHPSNSGPITSSHEEQGDQILNPIVDRPLLFPLNLLYIHEGSEVRSTCMIPLYIIMRNEVGQTQLMPEYSMFPTN